MALVNSKTAKPVALVNSKKELNLNQQLIL